MFVGAKDRGHQQAPTGRGWRAIDQPFETPFSCFFFFFLSLSFVAHGARSTRTDKYESGFISSHVVYSRERHGPQFAPILYDGAKYAQTMMSPLFRRIITAPNVAPVAISPEGFSHIGSVVPVVCGGQKSDSGS